MKRKLIKLSKGIALYSVFQLYDKYIGIDGLYKIKKTVLAFLSFLPETLASIIASLLNIIVGLFLVYCFVSGFYRMFTFYTRIPEFES
jgi:hypothetical protein